MGACFGGELEDDREDEIEQDLKDYDKLQEFRYKLLLLGAGESGKSTLLKQMRRIHGEPYTQAELLDAKPHILRNVMQLMRTLAIYSEMLVDEGQNTRVQKDVDLVRTRVAMLNERGAFTEVEYKDFVVLLADPGIKRTLELRDKFQMIDNAEYFIENMERFCDPEYVPAFEDLLHCRKRTSGVNKLEISFPNGTNKNVQDVFEVFDVGGQRNERRKWVHFFDHISAIIYVAALSGFNQTLWEDCRQNRMMEAVALFGQIVNIPAFKKSHSILFLNKSDLFREKIKYVKLSETFPEYPGPEHDYQKCIEFIQSLFANQRKDKSKLLYAHVTCATHQQDVRMVFNSVKDIILRQQMAQTAFV